MESYIIIQIQRTWTQCLHGPDHVNEKFFFFLDMVFNKVQFSQLVINEYVQLWYQLLIQIILYHGNPNWKLLISWLYTILLIHEGRPRWLSWMRRPTGDQEVAGSTPAEVGNILLWRLIMKYFLRSFSPFRWYKKGSCQFLAKECAQYWLTA